VVAVAVPAQPPVAAPVDLPNWVQGTGLRKW